MRTGGAGEKPVEIDGGLPNDITAVPCMDSSSVVQAGTLRTSTRKQRARRGTQQRLEETGHTSATCDSAIKSRNLVAASIPEKEITIFT